VGQGIDPEFKPKYRKKTATKKLSDETFPYFLLILLLFHFLF
jgi:hypothetical protein